MINEILFPPFFLDKACVNDFFRLLTLPVNQEPQKLLKSELQTFIVKGRYIEYFKYSVIPRIQSSENRQSGINQHGKNSINDTDKHKSYASASQVHVSSQVYICASSD